MNVASTISQFIGRLPIDKPFSNPYRGVLVTSVYKAERELFALLWAGLALIVLMTCLHMKTLFSDVKLHTIQPPPRIAIDIAAEHAKPDIHLKENNSESLFQLAEQDKPAIPPLAKSAERHVTRPLVVNKRPWQLHIERPAIPETIVNNEVASAVRQLQSGHVGLAKQVLQTVLTRDPHNVDAIEGMRLASRQLGDAESEQQYLQMLRLEIPDYDFDRDDIVIGGLD